MTLSRILPFMAGGFVCLSIVFSAWAVEYPAPKEGDWVVRDFRFHTGEVLPELR
jgi:homoserine O-acetyltransferase